jgi:hypothetical protein
MVTPVPITMSRYKSIKYCLSLPNMYSTQVHQSSSTPGCYRCQLPLIVVRILTTHILREPGDQWIRQAPLLNPPAPQATAHLCQSWHLIGKIEQSLSREMYSEDSPCIGVKLT